MKPYLQLMDITTGNIFFKYFNTEFDRDKFARKLRFSKKIRIIDSGYKEGLE